MDADGLIIVIDQLRKDRSAIVNIYMNCEFHASFPTPHPQQLSLSMGLHPVSVLRAQPMPLLRISLLWPTCVSGNSPFGLRRMVTAMATSARPISMADIMRSFNSISYFFI